MLLDQVFFKNCPEKYQSGELTVRFRYFQLLSLKSNAWHPHKFLLGLEPLTEEGHLRNLRIFFEERVSNLSCLLEGFSNLSSCMCLTFFTIRSRSFLVRCFTKFDTDFLTPVLTNVSHHVCDFRLSLKSL